MATFQRVFEQGDTAERIRQCLGPWAQWIGQFRQVSTHYCDILQGLSDSLQLTHQRAVQEERIRNNQTWAWRTQREPHEEIMDVVMMDSDEDITEEEALRMLRRDYGQ
ncbi:unnamed protein product, partial [Prorocentrum cordatum]